MEEFVEKADTNQDGRVTLNEVIGFEDFNFIASSFETVKEFGEALDPDIITVFNTETSPGIYSTKKEETYGGYRLGIHF